MFVSCRLSLAVLLCGTLFPFGQTPAPAQALPAPAQALPALAQALPAPVHAAYPSGTDSPLGQRIAALLADPQAASAQWGIAVTTLDGVPLYGMNEGKLFRPASNAKVFTSTAAIALVGAETTFTTRIVGNLEPGGIVRGDLTLVGAGDADFASGDLPYIAPANRIRNAPAPPPLADLAQMADQLVARGIKRIHGDIVGDDTLFPWEPYGESWAADDLVWGYGAPISALTIADNQLKLTITPGRITGAPGHQTFPRATIDFDQNGVDYYTVVNQVETHPAHTPLEGIDVERDPSTRTLRVYGALNEGSPPDTEHIAIDNPALYAAMALRQMLTARGIAIDGSVRAQHRSLQNAAGFLSQLRTPNPCDQMLVSGRGVCAESCAMYATIGPTLATHTSAPLAEDIVYTMKESQNLHAELLLHHLGRFTQCGQGSTVEGARLRQAFLVHAGLDPADFTLYDGSGLSAKDLIAPRAAVQLLQFAATQPWFSAWKPSLPEGGVDGTLGGRFKDPPLAHHVFAKTGTLGETNALSGYLDAASGRTLIFSILVDDHTPGSSASRKAMDQIVEAIAADD
jgi:D-alanyl-D-alanine carboxypeptidase/D-alanyl-D-alanine-endopeptidase (penicillin-binding protein 4)